MKTILNHVLSNKIEENFHITIISGTATGTDTLGERYAKEFGLDLVRIPAEWNKYGRSAGYLRNKQMAILADAVMAFWDGKSRGTKHMIEETKNLGKPIRIYNFIEGRFCK